MVVGLWWFGCSGLAVAVWLWRCGCGGVAVVVWLWWCNDGNNGEGMIMIVVVVSVKMGWK